MDALPGEHRGEERQGEGAVLAQIGGSFRDLKHPHIVFWFLVWNYWASILLTLHHPVKNGWTTLIWLMSSSLGLFFTTAIDKCLFSSWSFLFSSWLMGAWGVPFKLLFLFSSYSFCCLHFAMHLWQRNRTEKSRGALMICVNVTVVQVLELFH